MGGGKGGYADSNKKKCEVCILTAIHVSRLLDPLDEFLNTE